MILGLRLHIQLEKCLFELREYRDCKSLNQIILYPHLCFHPLNKTLPFPAKLQILFYTVPDSSKIYQYCLRTKQKQQQYSERIKSSRSLPKLFWAISPMDLMTAALLLPVIFVEGLSWNRIVPRSFGSGVGEMRKTTWGA